MNYIGSKYSLLREIQAILDDHAVPNGSTALDLFAGTAVVAQFLKSRGHITYANDWQYYSYVTGAAFIEYNDFPAFEQLLAHAQWREAMDSVADTQEICAYSIADRGPLNAQLASARVLRYLNQLPGKRGSFFEEYCDGGDAGRKYFSRSNGMRIQAIRDAVEEWSSADLISSQEATWLVACLVESADRIANTASVYGAYLKHVKRTAQKPLELVALHPIHSDHPAELHKMFCEDGLSLLWRFRLGDLGLVYIDPPYNHRQYAANYHVLETIARWDLGAFQPRGVTGLRDADDQRSDYCLGSMVRTAFRQLFERVNSDYVLFSYNNEGLLPKDELEDLFDEFCVDVDFRAIRYNRFRADVDHENRTYKADHTDEYLILGCPRTGSRQCQRAQVT